MKTIPESRFVRFYLSVNLSDLTANKCRFTYLIQTQYTFNSDTNFSKAVSTGGLESITCKKTNKKSWVKSVKFQTIETIPLQKFSTSKYTSCILHLDFSVHLKYTSFKLQGQWSINEVWMKYISKNYCIYTSTTEVYFNYTSSIWEFVNFFQKKILRITVRSLYERFRTFPENFQRCSKNSQKKPTRFRLKTNATQMSRQWQK